MGLFDNIGADSRNPYMYPKDPSEVHTSGYVIKEVVTFATLDLNGIFKMLVPAMVLWFKRAAYMIDDMFGHKDCNDEDEVLVERFTEQIPGMFRFLIEEGFYDDSILEALDKHPEGYFNFGRVHGKHPCNELIHPARLLFTILFGVRITNSDFLDALDLGVDQYYAAAGERGSDIPRIAVQRAVALKQKYFPSSTYNTRLWDLNIFQRFPLVAFVPDPEQVGKLYTGEFMDVNIVNGVALGTAVPNIQEATKQLDPNYVAPLAQPADTGSILDKIISFVKTDPLKAAAVGAALWFVWDEDEN